MNSLRDSVPHPSYWKCLEHYSNSPSELVHTAFVELSTAHLSKTNSVLCYSLKSRYMQNKSVFQTFSI